MKIGFLHSCIQDKRVLDYFDAILLRTDFETWDYCKKHNIDFLDCFYGQYSQRAKLRELIYPNIKYRHWLTIISQYSFVFLSANADTYPNRQDFSNYVKEMVNLFKPDVVGAMNECFEKRQSAEKVVRTTWDTAMGILNSVKKNIEICSWNQKIRTSEEKETFKEVLDNQQHKSVCKYVGIQSLETTPETMRKYTLLAQSKGFEVIDVELMTTSYRFSEIKTKFDNDRLLEINKVFIGCPFISEELADYNDMFNKYALSIGDFKKDKFKVVQYSQQFREDEQEEEMNKMLDDIIFEIVYVYGTRGIGVKRIQKVLNLWIKKNVPNAVLLEVSGNYDTRTRDVVKDFQIYAKLLVDGKAGKQTNTELLKFLLDRVEYYK